MSEPSILPPNASRVELIIEQALRHEIDLSVISTLMDPDLCPEHLLPWLAWALSVDFWDPDWPIETKRAVCRDSVWVHQRHGTVGSIRRHLEAAGYPGAEIIERFGWDLYDGSATYDGSLTYDAPDHWAQYRVKIRQTITSEQAARLREALGRIAPAHCHLVALDFSEAQHAFNGAITYDGSHSYGEA